MGKGENDTGISQIILNDSIQQFINYIKSTNISHSSQIESSLYETNNFLLDKRLALIEYSAFHGAILIINYLLSNSV